MMFMPPKTIFFNRFLFAGVSKYAELKKMPFTRAARILIKFGLISANDERDINQLQRSNDMYREKLHTLQNKLEELQ